MSNEVQTVTIDLGSVLRRYRSRYGLSQTDLAEALDLSQSYISRLETGARSPHRVDLLQRISATLGIPPSNLGISPAWFDDGDAEALYEKALILIGAADTETAIDLLTRVIDGGRGIQTTAHLQAKAQQRLADLKRDRFELTGPDGALDLYAKALQAFEHAGALNAARELRFVIGACYEMLDRPDLAAEHYRGVVDLARYQHSTQGEARAENRLGVLDTKQTSLEAAEEHIKVARQLALTLDDPFPYTFATEKAAILELNKGDFDKAHDLAMRARSDTNAEEPLRVVQNHLVTADIALSAGEYSEGIADIRKARAVALEHEYRHQLKAIDNLLKKHGA